MDEESEADPDQLARDCASVIWKNDLASQHLGMEIKEIAAGRAVLSMTVRDFMCNGFSICHGGVVFTLADSAFAFACNSYNQMAVAQHCTVTYLTPARIGDRLIATADERSKQGRSGIYDITVIREDGEQIALFRGHSRIVRGTHLPARKEEGRA